MRAALIRLLITAEAVTAGVLLGILIGTILS
jgi:hypothetical protein